MSELLEAVANATTKLPPSQASLTEQLEAAWLAATRLGLYDAADHLWRELRREY